ncbi:hypothetical protein C8R45DRAFT_994115 [Mycena sanguinolenta]|nr:hypothetical protein C8R45DRAFT_994115 [Mycena sanguinolenta]
MFSLFTPHASTPPPADMDCMPCTGFDVAARDVILTTGLIINTRLDAKKLEQSLSTLVKCKFPRAGARLALRNGVYEFQIPRTFDSNTQPIAFTAEDFAEPYRSAARPEIPTNLTGHFSSEPVVCPMPPSEGYFKNGTCPTSLEDLLVPNTPLIHVHVAIFDDVTFIGVTSGHITFDALGTRTLLHAWTRLLSGEDINAIPGMEWDMAPFDIFTGPTTRTHPRGWFNLGWLGQFLFILWFLLRIVRDPKEETRLIRVPKTFVENIKAEIMEDLKRQGSTEWVGSSDVLLAWWFKTLYSLRDIGDTTPIHIHLPVNFRDMPIFAGESRIATPYINNAASSIPFPPIPVKVFHTESIGEIALRLRRAILAYNADLGGLKADVHWRCANPFAERFPCPPGGEYTFQTNWRSARLGELDFSGARLQEADGGSIVRVVLAVGYVLSSQSIPIRGAGGLFMEDDAAVWMFQVRGTKDWESVRRSGRVAFV